jgi:glutaredoxin
MNDAEASQPVIEFYWRNGCPYCMSLVRGLRKHQVPLEMHHIHEEPDAAATVRRVAGGNETVPTVIIDDHALVNPTPEAVLGLLAELHPDYVLPDPPVREPRRWFGRRTRR